MRLTLRTMLAYMNNFLGPEDRQDIGRRIDESDAAKQLLQRTQEVTRRVKLAAPPVLASTAAQGSAPIHDANTVAEYLDHVLPSDEVHRFEAVCLESDVFLGEVASCHYVLTKVLGEPTVVDPALKEQMVRLIDAPHRPTAVAGNVPAPQAPPESNGKERKKPEVPAYLRDEPRSSLRTMVAALLIAALLAGGLLFAMGPLGPEHPLARFFSSEPIEPPPGAPDGDDATLPPVVDPGTPETDPAETPADPAAPDEPEPVPVDEELRQPAGVTPPEETPAELPLPVDEPSEPAESPPLSEEPPLPAETPLPAESPEQPTPPAEETPETGDEEPQDELARVDPPEVAPTPDDEPAEPPVPAPVPVPIGRLLSADEVLLRHLPEANNYELLPGRAVLNTGDELVVLPGFRPMITLSGVTMELDGGTRVRLEALDSDGHAEVSLIYGRAILMTVGRADARLKLTLGNHAGVVEFGDADSKLAVEVRPWREWGANPARTPARHAVDLYAASGNVSWQELANPLELRAPRRQVLTPHPDDAPPTATDPPDWVAARQVAALDRRAMPVIKQTLEADASPRPADPSSDVRLRLIELTDLRKTEVRGLAFRSCAHIGAYAPLVKALGDAEYKANWMQVCEALRDSLLRDPQAPAEILTQLERMYPENAPQLFRMLWGYSATGLTDRGEAAELVGFLSHHKLEVRLLAFWNLQEITGMGLYYKPEDRPAERAQPIVQWERRLSRGEIVPARNRRVAQ